MSAFAFFFFHCMHCHVCKIWVALVFNLVTQSTTVALAFGYFLWWWCFFPQSPPVSFPPLSLHQSYLSHLLLVLCSPQPAHSSTLTSRNYSKSSSGGWYNWRDWGRGRKRQSERKPLFFDHPVMPIHNHRLRSISVWIWTIFFPLVKSTHWFASLQFSFRRDTGEVTDGTSILADVRDLIGVELFGDRSAGRLSVNML